MASWRLETAQRVMRYSCDGRRGKSAVSKMQARGVAVVQVLALVPP